MTTLDKDKYRKMFDFLKKRNYAKVKGKSFEYFFSTPKNRQILQKAHNMAKKARKNQASFDSERLDFIKNISEEKQKEFIKRLNSGKVSKKTVDRYEKALADVKANGGMQAPKEILKELRDARSSVGKTYNLRIEYDQYNNLKQKLKDGDISQNNFTEDQKRVFNKFKSQKDRASLKGRKDRSDRGLYGKGATLEGQKTRLNQSFDSFVKERAVEGYADWLKYNEGKGETAHLSNLLEKDLTPKQQAALWWDKLLPESEKEKWRQELREPYDHNRKITKKYHDLEKVVPPEVAANLQKQLHHIYPRSMGGGHFPGQIASVSGDAFSARGSDHGLLHDPKLDKFYSRFEGQNWMPFDFNDPNIITRASGEPEINKKGVSYLDSLAKGLMNFGNTPGGQVAKKAGKVAARALPFLGAAFDAQAANEHFSKGNEVLGTLAAAQAVPVLGDVFGLPLAAAEGIGSIYNRDQKVQEERDRQRGLFGYTPPKRFRGFGGLSD